MSSVNPWRTGFAARNITPPVGTRQSGFVIRQKPSSGVHDPLFARVFALHNRDVACCLVILDLLGVDLALTRAIRREVSKRVDIPLATVAVLATHTHGGPGILPHTYLGPVDAPFRAYVVHEAVAAVVEAFATPQPAELRIGVGRETTIAHNRRDPAGPIDPAVPVMRFDREGKLAALLASYACHPNTLGPDNLQITRDYPGDVVAALERLHPNALVAFATGCCGQINTGHRAEDSLQLGDTSKRTFEEAHRIGYAFAEIAEKAAEGALAKPPLSGPLQVACSVINLPVVPPPEATEAELDRWRRELVQNAGRDRAREAILQALIAWGNAAHLPSQDVEVEVMCIGLGEACIAIYPGEMFVEFGLELKSALPDNQVVTLGYGNAVPGYLPHRSAYLAGGYEVEEAYRFYGQLGPFPREAGERVQEEMLRLAKEVLA